MKITFLGGGNMANALIGGLLANGFSASEIAVIELNEDNRARLSVDYGVRCHAAPDAQALDCEVLVLAVHQGCSYDEIAAILSIPVGTVKSRVFNALSALQEMYDEKRP